jgi:glycosyltransferase involved in cell wall biosynthesis
MAKRLIIGVDIRDLRVAKTGTKTYLEELCKAFKAVASPDVDFRFIDSTLPAYSGTNKLLKWLEHINYQFWKQVSLPIRCWIAQCDIVFCTDNFVPLIKLGYKTIPVFHDAFFFEMPDNYGKLWLWLYKKTALPAAQCSPFVITPTHYAKKQIARHTTLPEKKLKVVYEGPKSFSGLHTNSVNEQSLLAKFSLHKYGYLFHAGAMFKRKNIPFLVSAFNGVMNTGQYPMLKLVLAGQLPADKKDSDFLLVTHAINQSPYKNQIILTGYVSDSELAELYQNALLYVFPSLNEGFGIPILEAFKNQVPVLAANNTSLPEVGGDAVMLFDPFDSTDLTDKIITLIYEDDLRRQMISKGTERLKRFSWQRAAEELTEIFKAAVKKTTS